MTQLYEYTARDMNGRAMKGVLSAHSPEALAEQIKRMGYVITGWKLKRQSVQGVSSGHFFKRVKGEDMVMLSIQLSKMIHAGIPLVKTLQTQVEQTQNKHLREAIRNIAKQIEQGSTFSEGLAKYPDIFSDFFINLVIAGESSGRLSECLERLSGYMRRQNEIKAQIITSMTYPLLMLVVGVGVMGVLVGSVIPKFIDIFIQAQIPLPTSTRLIYETSLFLKNEFWWIALLIGAICIGANLYARTDRGRLHIDGIILAIPMLGDLIRKLSVSRICGTMAAMLASGISMLEALKISRRVSGNKVIAEAVKSAEKSVESGGSVTEPLRRSGQFPLMVLQMIDAGEKSGTVDEMLVDISEYYEQMFWQHLKRMTALIEPIFLVVMGGMVALIMSGLLSAIFQMVKTAGG